MKLAFFAAILATASAAEQDRSGVYVSGCLPTVTCVAEVEKTGKGKWRLDWSATNRVGTTTYCRHSVDLKVGVGHSASVDRMENVLVGKTEDGTFLMVDSDADTGRAFLYLDGMPCESVKLPAGERGMIGFNGFYDLEGDV